MLKGNNRSFLFVFSFVLLKKEIYSVHCNTQLYHEVPRSTGK